MSQLSVSEQWTLLRIAEAATPPGRYVGLPDGGTIESVERILSTVENGTSAAYRALVHALDLAAVPLSGKRLSALPIEERTAVLERLNSSDKTFWLVRAVTIPIKIAQSELEPLESALGVKDGHRLPVAREHNRWEQQIVDARTLQKNEELEVDVVIVGTGAGGAPMAKALASRGHAVVMIEEG